MDYGSIGICHGTNVNTYHSKRLFRWLEEIDWTEILASSSVVAGCLEGRLFA